MTQISAEVLARKAYRDQHEAEIAEIRDKYGNAAASSAGIFASPYFGKFPVDVQCTGTICAPELWTKVQMPENMPHPTTNPVWDFKMPESCQGIGAHHPEWLFTLIKVELNHGYPAEENEYAIIYNPIDELYTLETAHNWDKEINQKIFTVGKKVGFVQYPTSKDYDLWMLLEPNQESLDHIEEYYNL